MARTRYRAASGLPPGVRGTTFRRRSWTGRIRVQGAARRQVPFQLARDGRRPAARTVVVATRAFEPQPRSVHCSATTSQHQDVPEAPPVGAGQRYPPGRERAKRANHHHGGRGQHGSRQQRSTCLPVPILWHAPSSPGGRPRHVAAVRELPDRGAARRDGAVLPAARLGVRRVLPRAAQRVRDGRGDLHRVRLLLVVLDELAASTPRTTSR